MTADVINIAERRPLDTVLACRCGCETIMARRRGTAKTRLHCVRCGDDRTADLLRP